jgi:hypothetical protein
MTSMYDIECPRHGQRVLLFGSQVRLANTTQGIEVHWTCSCGATGVERVGALAPHAAHASAPAVREDAEQSQPTPVGTAA